MRSCQINGNEENSARLVIVLAESHLCKFPGTTFSTKRIQLPELAANFIPTTDNVPGSASSHVALPPTRSLRHGRTDVGWLSQQRAAMCLDGSKDAFFDLSAIDPWSFRC
jgi:hypothetical protein